jgi:hypothetical protein
VPTVDRFTLASVSNCESADLVVRNDRWSSRAGTSAPYCRLSLSDDCERLAGDRLHASLTDFDLGGIVSTPDRRCLLFTQRTTGRLWRIWLRRDRETIRGAGVRM